MRNVHPPVALLQYQPGRPRGQGQPNRMETDRAAQSLSSHSCVSARLLRSPQMINGSRQNKPRSHTPSSVQPRLLHMHLLYIFAQNIHIYMYIYIYTQNDNIKIYVCMNVYICMYNMHNGYFTDMHKICIYIYIYIYTQNNEKHLVNVEAKSTVGELCRVPTWGSKTKHVLKWYTLQTGECSMAVTLPIFADICAWCNGSR